MPYFHALLAVCALLLGCTTTRPAQPPPVMPARVVASASTPAPPAPQFESFLPSDPQLRTAILTYQRTHTAPIIRRATSVLIPFLDQPVTVRCQQLLATDIRRYRK